MTGIEDRRATASCTTKGDEYDEAERTKWREWLKTAMREWIETANRRAEHEFNAIGKAQQTCLVFTTTGTCLLPPMPEAKLFYKRLRKMKAIGYVITDEAWMVMERPTTAAEAKEQFDRYSHQGAVRDHPNAVKIVTFSAFNGLGGTLMGYRDIIRRSNSRARFGPLIVPFAELAIDETGGVAVMHDETTH